MSGIFSRPKIVQAVTEHVQRPDPRDEAARTEAERMRRSGQNRGRQSTVLTRSLRRAAPANTSPRRTVIGGGGP